MLRFTVAPSQPSPTQWLFQNGQQLHHCNGQREQNWFCALLLAQWSRLCWRQPNKRSGVNNPGMYLWSRHCDSKLQNGEFLVLQTATNNNKCVCSNKCCQSTRSLRHPYGDIHPHSTGGNGWRYYPCAFIYRVQLWPTHLLQSYWTIINLDKLDKNSSRPPHTVRQ